MEQKSDWKHKAGHFWDDCSMCGRMVVCGKCGNNSCNGGYGNLPNGLVCDACPSAYETQDQGERKTEATQ